MHNIAGPLSTKQELRKFRKHVSGAHIRLCSLLDILIGCQITWFLSNRCLLGKCQPSLDKKKMLLCYRMIMGLYQFIMFCALRIWWAATSSLVNFDKPPVVVVLFFLSLTTLLEWWCSSSIIFHRRQSQCQWWQYWCIECNISVFKNR